MPGQAKTGAPRVYYVGWLGHQNLGDEAMYACIRELFPLWSFVGPAVENEKRWKSRWRRPRYQAAMLGGGTLINRSGSVLRELEQRSRSHPAVVFGSGVANPHFWKTRPTSWKDHAAEWISLLGQFKYVGVRGPLSRDLLQGWGLNSVEVIGDPALYLTRKALVPKSRRKRIGINLGTAKDNLWGSDEAGLVQKVLTVGRALLDRGFHLTLFPVWTEDWPLIQELYRQWASPRVEILEDFLSLPVVLRRLEEMDLFLGMKLHSGVLAACVGTPFILLEYRPKCRDFMVSLGREDYCLRTDTVEVEQVLERIESLWKDLETHQQEIHRGALDYQQRLMGAAKKVSRLVAAEAG